MAKTLITGAAQSVTEVARRAAEVARNAAAAVTGKEESKPKTPRASVKANMASSNTKRSGAKKAVSARAKKAKK